MTMKCRKRHNSMFSGRRGSALLIVLGMFAFMLVSAVSFSIYMRASRAPSSYVRRNASARQLVKAALARAIDEIDTAIGNDPFPGVGYNSYKSRSGVEPDPQTGGDKKEWFDRYRGKNDNWHGRVFTPAGAVPAKETVSTLTLEALGYIPPCLVNEARYWSRHTRTAKWHPFSYGLGQYAFTAINVSDFFDLGALAGKDNGQERQYLNRSSASHGRISPTYLFRGGEKVEQQNDLTAGKTEAKDFLDALSGSLKTPSEVPLVSLMDFNLSYRGSSFAVAPPFLAESGGYLGGKISKEDALSQVFIAGGWDGDMSHSYQAYNNGNAQPRINLRYPECQPFSGCGWFPDNTSLYDCYQQINPESHPFWKPVKCDFPALSIALLCDYLDYDNVPLSLCIPCTEAVPMVCGVELSSDVKYQMNVLPDVELTPANPEQGIKKKIKRTYSMKVDINQFKVAVDAVYPFINGPQGQNAGYTAEAFARIFFTTQSGNDDDNLADAGLRAPGTGLAFVDKAQWDWSGTTESKYIQITLGDKSLTANSVEGAVDAAEVNAIQNLQMTMSGALSKDGALVDLVYEIDADGKETLVEEECVGHDNFTFFDNLTAWDGNKVLECFKQNNCPVTFRPSVAVWVRIKNSEGKTVDMVPAVPSNDVLIDPGKESSYDRNKGLPEFDLAMGGGAGDPLLRFFPKKNTDNGIVFTADHFKNNTGARNADWKQKSYIANDPRINWAPEHWWATAEIKDPAKLWLDNVRDFQDGNNWCDSDIFMSVSDQGYMQSMYEWLLIPQVLRIRKEATNYETTRYTTKEMLWGYFNGGNGYDGVVNTAVGDVQHSGIMWRTHKTRAFLDPGNSNWDWGRVDLLPFDEQDVGLRVNPYTDITNIMMGAFANMPRDWWAAGTNQYASGKNYMSPGGSFKDDYLFDWSKTGEDVYRMASFWMSVFSDKDADNLHCLSDYPDPWASIFDGYTESVHNKEFGYQGGSQDIIDWYDGEVLYKTTANYGSDVQDILQADLTLADRKFLYGYLKGCFANTHQLFLVFVRAETVAGGGGAGSGARAVALVYRDPKAPKDASAVGDDNASIYLSIDGEDDDEGTWSLKKRDFPPHKSHVLFYHQLD